MFGLEEGMSKEEVFGIHQAVDTFGKNSAAAQVRVCQVGLGEEN